MRKWARSKRRPRGAAGVRWAGAQFAAVSARHRDRDFSRRRPCLVRGRRFPLQRAGARFCPAQDSALIRRRQQGRYLFPNRFQTLLQIFTFVGSNSFLGKIDRSFHVRFGLRLSGTSGNFGAFQSRTVRDRSQLGIRIVSSNILLRFVGFGDLLERDHAAQSRPRLLNDR